jgi:hypothetical protein
VKSCTCLKANSFDAKRERQREKRSAVNVTGVTADLLQSDLEKVLKQNVPPIICFDHAEKRAAAIPKRLPAI